MKLAVALLTCDRYDYTVRTVESLLEHNDVAKWNLLYADDASTDPRIRPYVESKGFEPLVLNDTRLGCSPTTEALMVAIAERHPGIRVLYLQNDFESVRPLPEGDIRKQLEDDDTAFAQLTYRKPRNRYNRRLAFYWPDEEAWKFGDTSRGEHVYTQVGGGLGYHPFVACIDVLVHSTAGVLTEKGFRRSTITLGKKIVRYTRPVMRHIGRHSTPDGMFGRRKHKKRARVGRASYEVVQ